MSHDNRDNRELERYFDESIPSFNPGAQGQGQSQSQSESQSQHQPQQFYPNQQSTELTDSYADYYNNQHITSSISSASPSNTMAAFANTYSNVNNNLPQGSHYQSRHDQYLPQSHQYASRPSQAPSQDSVAGPSRQSSSARRDHGSGAGGSRTGPYSRPNETSAARDDNGLPLTVKASSTTSEFTKRKNWSQHIIDEIQDFMHVLSPTGEVVFCTASIVELSGWTADDLIGRPIADFVHGDDVEGFLRDFTNSVQNGTDLNLYYRFRMKDERYTIFEIAGHPYYVEDDGVRTCKCFFGMGRPYPSKNTAMLDSFLELKMENEKLRQELQVMYEDIESGAARGSQYGFTRDRRPALNSSGYGVAPESSDSAANASVDPITGLAQTSGILPSSSNAYGALGTGISATGVKGDGTGGEKKKKQKARLDDGEFVCRDCGTVDSPEWRKGPEGPKSLCNACGLRYAKLKSKDKQKALAENK